MSSKTTQFFVELLILGPAPDMFTHIATGGFRLSGLGISSSSLQDFFFEGDGNLSFSGFADSDFIFNMISAGQLTLGGSFDQILGVYTFESSGSISIGNLNITDSGYVFIGAGGIILTGLSSSNQDLQLISSGSISISNVLASLTISNNPFLFTWKLRRRDFMTKRFSWATENARIRNFYRVVGIIRRPIYRPITVPFYGKSSSVVLLHATSVADVCRKLKLRNFIHPIATVEQYTNNLNKNVPYTELTDVTPTYRLLACAEFFIDFDVKVAAVASSQAFYSIPLVFPGGQIALSNIVDFSMGVDDIATGRISISGVADFSIGL